MIVHLLKWNLNILERIILYVLFGGIFIFQQNVFTGNLSIIQLTMIISVLYFHEKHRFIFSGIFLGLSTIDPVSMLLAVIVLLAIIIAKRDFTILLWFIITIGLLLTFTFIFDKKWIIGWLKNLILTPVRFPFKNYTNVFATKYDYMEDRFIIALPIFIVSWLFLEIARTPKETSGEHLWLLGFGGLLNYFFMLQEGSYSSVLFLPSIILIVYEWWKRIKNPSRYLLYFFLVLLSIGIYVYDFYVPGEFLLQNMENMIFLIAIFLAINLYWSRLWIIRPFSISKTS
jgi:hypothetical protein